MGGLTDPFESALATLEGEGITTTPHAREQLQQFAALVRHWNDYASLMSLGDITRIEAIHIPDALSLARLIVGAVQGDATWLDIGSGGGFPALPVRIVVGELPLALLERSEKKASVLRQMLGTLHLEAVSLVNGEFPGAFPHPTNNVVITARAVEQAERLHRAMSRWMQPGDVFLCQALEPGVALMSPMFDVERVNDTWSQNGLRRGSLHRVTRLPD